MKSFKNYAQVVGRDDYTLLLRPMLKTASSTATVRLCTVGHRSRDIPGRENFI